MNCLKPDNLRNWGYEKHFKLSVPSQIRNNILLCGNTKDINSMRGMISMKDIISIKDIISMKNIISMKRKVMCMAVAHKTTIAFSLVSIPISLYTATQDNDLHFNQLCREDHSRVRYKKICAGCGKEVSSQDIIKGFEYDKDKYVIVTDDEFEKVKSPRDKSIQILHFAQLNQISPVYYDKTYQAVPEAGGEKAFELLRRALMDSQKIAVGRTVLGTKDTLLALIPREDGMLVQTMFYADEIRDLPKGYSRPEVSEQELSMAQTLIESMNTPFNPAAYHDEYQQKLRELIETKIAGKEVVSAADEQPGKIIDLMDALKASIEQTKPDKPKRTPRKKIG